MNQFKIIHIFIDDKFPPMAHKAFDQAFPGSNQFIIFTDVKELVYNKDIGAKLYSRHFLKSKLFLRYVLRADLIVFHSMTHDALIILESLPKTAKTIWLGWGYDYYDLIGRELLKKLTEKNLPKKEIQILSSKQKLKRLIRCFLFGKEKVYSLDEKAHLINRVNIFSPVLEEDYSLVKRALPDFKPKYASWNYGTLEDNLIRGFEDKVINGNNILLGNSASATNNHLDAFPLIKKLELSNRKVITPLSYGDEAYRNEIIKSGNESLGENFYPLVDFMPIDGYIAVLQSCSVVIMNHLRQQALGNIVIALYMGAKVFLDKENPVYSFFSNLGTHIYSLEQLQDEYSSLLDKERIEHNRKILRNYWGREVILEKTKNIVEKALSL